MAERIACGVMTFIVFALLIWFLLRGYPSALPIALGVGGVLGLIALVLGQAFMQIFRNHSEDEGVRTKAGCSTGFLASFISGVEAALAPSLFSSPRTNCKSTRETGYRWVKR